MAHNDVFVCMSM